MGSVVTMHQAPEVKAFKSRPGCRASDREARSKGSGRKLAGESVGEAAQVALDEVAALGGDGGVLRVFVVCYGHVSGRMVWCELAVVAAWWLADGAARRYARRRALHAFLLTWLFFQWAKFICRCNASRASNSRPVWTVKSSSNITAYLVPTRADYLNSSI